MPAPGRSQHFSAAAQVGWEAAWLEIEHQAEHWDTPDHGEIGHLLAEALRAAALIGRAGGLRCAHRAGSVGVPGSVLAVIEATPTLAPLARPPAAA
jgi:hypothetical protein